MKMDSTDKVQFRDEVVPVQGIKRTVQTAIFSVNVSTEMLFCTGARLATILILIFQNVIFQSELVVMQHIAQIAVFSVAVPMELQSCTVVRMGTISIQLFLNVIIHIVQTVKSRAVLIVHVNTLRRFLFLKPQKNRILYLVIKLYLLKVLIGYQGQCGHLFLGKNQYFRVCAHLTIYEVLLTLKFTIALNSSKKLTINMSIFLITDGRSEIDPTPLTKMLKDQGSIIFIVGLGLYDRSQLETMASVGKDGEPLFYGLTNFQVVKKIADYINTVNGQGVRLNYCSLYCGCLKGSEVLYRCPSILHFNPSTSKCDLPSRAGCKSSQIVTSGREHNISETDFVGGYCPSSVSCPSLDPLGSKIFLPHSSMCNLFCGCKDGTSNLYRCPNNLHFNPKLKLCDLPSHAGCTSESNGNISNCNLYCECWQGVPRLRRCGSGLHFSGVTNRCENPSQARCQGDCAKILPTTGSVWEPESCVKDLSRMGDKCRISCLSGYELIGSSNIACTEKGWNGTGGLNVLPKCKVPEELGIEFVDNIAKEVSGPDSDFLFMLDESGSLSPEQFGTQLSFVKAVVSAFPLSQKRYAGVLTFSGSAWVDVNMKHGDTCKFLNAVQKIKYQGGTTDIRLALVTATREILKNSVHNRTLVCDNAGEMSPGSSTESYPAFARIGLRENPGKNLNQVWTLGYVRQLKGTGIMWISDIFFLKDASTFCDNSKAIQCVESRLSVLITDGQSDTDPTLAANTLKKEGNFLFTVGIGDYERRELESIASVGKDGAPLFYGITNFVVFNKIAEYLHTDVPQSNH
ncbi:hypothetical protein ANN_01497 [Periplaneta americana]|uniref:Uncharacterized protein n=1 Tax=Periplaneta americana TaxID=6978 RepID=A0ABQ8TXU5_PERAM|nr:hypothetical protein ANN_01497 [Periplaneta americana]